MIRLGILGYPLSHSLSPRFQQLFLEASGLEGTYEKFEVAPEVLHFWLGARPAVRGLNVTIPHKVTVMAYCDALTDAAQQIGAVNTLCFEVDGKTLGHNTDGVGFMAPLAGRNLSGLHAVILGTGGASRAVAVGLVGAGVSKITYISRNPEKATQTLADLVLPLKPQAQVVFEAGPEAIDWSQVGLVVNTTPVGMSSNTTASPLAVEALRQLPSSALVYDLVYNPLETQLLKDSKALGLETQDGLAMLIAQGAESFRLWTGIQISAEVLSQAKARLESLF